MIYTVWFSQYKNGREPNVLLSPQVTQTLVGHYDNKNTHTPDLMLPSSRMTLPQREYTDRLLFSLSRSRSPSLFSISCFSRIRSQFRNRKTRCFSTKFLQHTHTHTLKHILKQMVWGGRGVCVCANVIVCVLSTSATS